MEYLAKEKLAAKNRHGKICDGKIGKVK